MGSGVCNVPPQDINFLLSKHVPPNGKLVSDKLREAGIADAIRLLPDYMERIGRTWEQLTPLVQHALEDYDSVLKPGAALGRINLAKSS